MSSSEIALSTAKDRVLLSEQPQCHASAPWRALGLALVGSISERCLMHPIDFAKTFKQLASLDSKPTKVEFPRFNWRIYYSGFSAAIASATVKPCVRVMSYWYAGKLLRSPEDGSLSIVRSTLIGAFTGGIEAFVAVAPFERLKTLQINGTRNFVQYASESQKAAFSPQGGNAALSDILADQSRKSSFLSLFRGSWITFWRAFATSNARFMSFNACLHAVHGNIALGEAPSQGELIVGGTLAAILTALVTQPLDTLKTRLQAAPLKLDQAKQQPIYKGVLSSTIESVRHQGIRSLWLGSVPRMCRFAVSVLCGVLLFRQMDMPS